MVWPLRSLSDDQEEVTMPGYEGMPVDTLIWMVKEAVTESGVSRLSKTQDLRVASVHITLQVLATKSGSTEVSIRVPFTGTELGARGKLTNQDTNTIDITLAPPAQPKRRGVRGLPIDKVLVNAIATIRDAMASAATGNDPWELSQSTVSLAFGVTKTGTISLGVEGERSTDVMHTLRLTLKPADRVDAADVGQANLYPGSCHVTLRRGCGVLTVPGRLS
jgi:hypothetical protein